MVALTFVFAPCVPSIEPQYMIMVTLTTVLLRFECSLFPLVALLVRNFPLYCCPLPCLPSLLFRQRAAALPSSVDFIDPPALFSMLSCFLCLLKTLESLPYVFPCFSNLKHALLPFGSFVVTFHICSFSFFKHRLFCRYLYHCPSSSIVF